VGERILKKNQNQTELSGSRRTPGGRLKTLHFKSLVMSLVNWRNRHEMLPVLTFPNWVDNFFKDDDFFDNRFFGKEMTVPAVNVSETKEAYHLEVAAPGMKKSDFKIEVKDGALVISAETKSEKEEKGDNYTRKEFSFNSFSRSFWLPENVKQENIKATYTDGILKLAVPKVALAKEPPVKQIAVS
jgi:HSP20 family protein